MRKVGIFGGTFDPFTAAHLEIVRQALEQNLVDVVYVCPTIVTWHRKGYEPWLSDEQKLAVVRAMLKTNPLTYSRAMVDDEDLALRRMCEGSGFLSEKYVKEHRFIDTLVRIKARRDEDDELWPIIGPDEFENFESWYAYDSILKLSAGLLVVTDEEGNGRDGEPVDPVVGSPVVKSVRPLKIAKRFMDVSATKERDAFRGLGWKAYLDTALREADARAPKTTLLHTPIFDVVEGAKTATGLEPVLINAPDWITVVVEKGGRFLVERQFRYGSGAVVAEFPCGMVEPGEDPADTAKRELEEETGIRVKGGLEYLGSANPNPAFMTNRMHYFYVDLDEAEWRQVGQKLDEHESLTVSWERKQDFAESVEALASAGRAERVPAMLISALRLYEKSVAPKKKGPPSTKDLLDWMPDESYHNG